MKNLMYKTGTMLAWMEIIDTSLYVFLKILSDYFNMIPWILTFSEPSFPQYIFICPERIETKLFLPMFPSKSSHLSEIYFSVHTKIYWGEHGDESLILVIITTIQLLLKMSTIWVKISFVFIGRALVGLWSGEIKDTLWTWLLWPEFQVFVTAWYREW